MSKYGIYYKIAFTNCERDGSETDVPQDVVIKIFDRSLVVDDSASQLVYELIPAGDPLHTSSIDNSEDKFTPVRATQATIKFLSDANFDLSTFADSPIPFGGTDPGDPRWYVEAYCNSLIIFKGFLVLDDCSQNFLPNPNEVTLTATDNLGILKDTPLTLFVTNDPTNYRIADFLAGALSQTGLSLPINVVFNIREANFPTYHLFDKVWLWDKTVEGSLISEYENAYSVLEKILGEGGSVTQRCGEWWIYRVSEFGGTVYRTIFNSDGSVNSSDSFTLDKTIVKDNSPVFFSRESTNVLPTRPNKYIKEIYKFETPKELICNIDFSRGDFIADLPDEVIDGVNYHVKKYQAECWTYERDGGVINADYYIKKYFTENGYEANRLLFLPTTPGPDSYYVVSNIKLSLSLKDKFDIGVSFRYSSDISSGTDHSLQVRLYGNDGSHWFLAGNSQTGENYWRLSNSGWSSNISFLTFVNSPSDVDMSQLQSVSFTNCQPVPVAGDIEVRLVNDNSPQSRDKELSSLQFTLYPFINGSYQKYSDLFAKISRTESLKAKREREVSVSDGIRKFFKGAMMTFDGSNYNLTDEFFDWFLLQGTPSSGDIHPYLWLQAYDVWNQYRNVTRIFQAACQGLESNTTDALGKCNYPSLVHTYTFGDVNTSTNNRKFQLLHFDIDWFLCEWSGTLAEILNSDHPRTYDDTIEIKYE